MTLQLGHEPTFISDCVRAISGISKCKDWGTVSPAKKGLASEQNTYTQVKLYDNTWYINKCKFPSLRKSPNKDTINWPFWAFINWAVCYIHAEILFNSYHKSYECLVRDLRVKLTPPNLVKNCFNLWLRTLLIGSLQQVSEP